MEVTTRWSLTESNDWFHGDGHFINGLEVAALLPAVSPGSAWDRPYQWLDQVMPESGPAVMRPAVILGQDMYGPDHPRADPPNPHDRPFAGWLYGGASLLRESGGDRLDNLELVVGVVGPAALASETQHTFHRLIGQEPVPGWHDQIHDEPGLMVSFDRRWRVGLADGIDVVPDLGATIGNVLTYGEAGAMLRLGTNLGLDYGPAGPRPGPSGTHYVNPAAAKGDWGWYFYLGAQGRVVGRDIFLDGNTFRPSPSVPKNTLVGDLRGGMAVFSAGGLRLDFDFTARSKEYVGQTRADVYATFTLAFAW